MRSNVLSEDRISISKSNIPPADQIFNLVIVIRSADWIQFVWYFSFKIKEHQKIKCNLFNNIQLIWKVQQISASGFCSFLLQINISLLLRAIYYYSLYNAITSCSRLFTLRVHNLFNFTRNYHSLIYTCKTEHKISQICDVQLFGLFNNILFRTLSEIYDGAFLRNSSIIDIWQNKDSQHHEPNRRTPFLFYKNYINQTTASES